MDALRIDTIRDNASRVMEKIGVAAISAGRDPVSVRLVAVTKGHPPEMVRAAVDAGLRLFGENYVEEALDKIQMLAGEANLEWHMIGHLQSRKARLVCQHFDVLESLDSLKLGARLDRFAGEMRRRLPVLLECNVSGEETKHGIPAWQEERWPGLDEEIASVLELPNLEVRGLMTMAPYFEEAEMARPTFQKLGRLRNFLARRFPQASWNELSMGMSADFRVAVQEGATIVRIGTAIMGPRG
jgi:hypothetical protein